MNSLELGPVPYEESCQQVGTPTYDTARARRECRVYRRMLERLFPIPRDANVRFKTRSFAHDFGHYPEVCVDYALGSPSEGDAADAVLDYVEYVSHQAPATWDAIAHFELAWFERRDAFRAALRDGRAARDDVPAQYLDLEPPTLPPERSFRELLEAFPPEGPLSTP